MKINFYGAAKCVTGSCYHIQTQKSTFLVDCGMRQGSDAKKSLTNSDFPFDVSEVDFVLLTHAHIDHSGYIPLLAKNGFEGKIVTTTATKDLCSIMLPDSGHIQEMEVLWKNRKLKRKGMQEIEPLYTVQDAQNSLDCFEGLVYGQKVSVSSDVEVRFRDAGHLLGSASIEIWVKTDNKVEKIVFSGDIGNVDKPIIKDPTYLEEADLVVMESTYGDRLHKDTAKPTDQLRRVLNDAIKRGGNIVIPSFAIGRTQEVLYDISKFINDGSVPGLEKMPVYIDSPLGIRATEIFEEDYAGYYDREAMKLKREGVEFLDFRTLNVAMSPEESKAINFIEEPVIIISSSGMCDAGRIKHHLKHNIWKSESTVIFVGYQAFGTLGRRILDGADEIKIFGDEIKVRAKIERVEGFSGHADKDGLLKWIDEFDVKPQKVFVTHGEESVAMSFADTLSQKGYNVVVPSLGQYFDTSSKSFETDMQFKVSDFDSKQDESARKQDDNYNEIKGVTNEILKRVAGGGIASDKVLAKLKQIMNEVK